MSEPRTVSLHNREQLELRRTEAVAVTNHELLPWQYFNGPTMLSVATTAIEALDEVDRLRIALEYIGRGTDSAASYARHALDPADPERFRTYAEIRDDPRPPDPTHEETMDRVRSLTGQKEETE